MWVVYLISLPLILGMVIFTLRYFASPDVPRYVLFTVEYAWFYSLSVIILCRRYRTQIMILKMEESHFFRVGLIGVLSPYMGFKDGKDFSVTERLKTSVSVNLVFYSVVGSIGHVGIILLISMNRNWSVGILGAFLLGFGFSEVPKTLWRNENWTIRQKVLSHKIAKMTVAQATSNQMSKRDPLRPYMDVISNMLPQMGRPVFLPQGGQLGENDIDYDSDEKSMAKLRRHLWLAREEYYQYKRKYVLSFRFGRFGKMGMLLDKRVIGALLLLYFRIKFIWLCILRKQLRKVFAIVLGIMSAMILLAEATLLPRGVDLSIFCILIYSVKKQEVFAFIPLMYMCICTYYSLFKIGMLMFYSLIPWRTSSVSLLMICSMVARYAPLISYNFFNLINRGGKKTIFENVILL
ncbi:hypothetical protein CXB51_031609 [Gossypium anomalum]|uniref:LMBR1-like membrane protein n=1 Tax=Gossypium anomalum TaxID=47600 RepID=A0A8J5Y0Z8_9ROSI|nr:hypothetical protein CXB51_031609 [Gossypium anomalum]